MAVKRTGQLGFADAVVGGGSGVLDKIAGLVRWYRFEHLLKRFNHEDAGRPAWSAMVKFRCLILGALYGLSERELEEAVMDRLSFRRFVGLSLEEGVPDHSVLNRFRNELVRQGLFDKLFAELDKQMEAAGVMLKHGTMLDATVIPTSAARPGRDGVASDPDAGFAKRQGKAGSSYGYKAHVGVDQGSGLIRSVLATPANVNDTTPADALIRGDEASVLADAAYHTHARCAQLRQRGIKPRIAVRANKHHPRLPERLARFNRLVARRRAGVETTFATLKNRMKLSCIRYRGLLKATAQITLAALAFNLRRWAAITP